MMNNRANTLLRAAQLLRGDRTGSDVDQLLAELLERIAEVAPYWAEPYAMMFVPIIESAYRVADRINNGCCACAQCAAADS